MSEENRPGVDDAGARIEQRIREVVGDDAEKITAVKKLLQSETDRRVEAGVRRFREETLPKHVQVELEKINSQKPEDVIATKERALEVAARLGVDYQAVSRLFLAEGDLGDRADAFEELVKGAQISYVEEKLKIHGVNPPKAQPVWDGSLTRNDLKRMTPEQISKAMAGGRLDSMLRGGR